ncbi:MAG: LysR family transcriptional regulator [Eubacteriales bacterium]|nr:LysR family transcriptional regulator [Eubacteriales bacterium]
MDLKQVEYILKIAEENNITKAAQKLYITQSALNQQLLKLEEELGIPLFYRSRTNWRPTEAGEIYLKAAREMLHMKKEAYNQIHDLAERKKGTLAVGFTPGRGIEMFSEVYPRFHRTHYKIQVEPRELSVRRQQELISAGELDIGFVTYGPKFKSRNVSARLGDEELLLAIPRIHPYARLACDQRGCFTEGNLYELREEPFVLIYKESTLHEMVEEIFERAGFCPNVLFETSDFRTIVTMIESGFCCGILPYYYVRRHLDTMACFSLPGNPRFEIAAIYQRNSYLSKAARDFISMAREFWMNAQSNT